MLQNGPILVMGAGSIGCYLGGRLQAAGSEVVFVGRARVLGQLKLHGMTLSDLDGGEQHIDAAALQLHDALPAGIAPALVLLAVKSGATAQAAELLSALPAGTCVVSMQNGIGNADLGRALAPHLTWLAGMVPFNVAELPDARFHRGNHGAVAVQDHPALRACLDRFTRAGLALQLHADLRSVQWGKLLINLNNPVNALSGRPLRAQLLERGYRRVLADLQLEALALLDAGGIKPAQVAALAPHRMPRMLKLPNWIFRRLAARMVRVDEKARSSMADDLAAGRITEIDALCGEICRLALRLGRSAPLNTRMIALVEAWPDNRTFLSPEAMRRALGASSR